MEYTDDPRPWHRLACRLLLDGALGAHAQDPFDMQWVNGAVARLLAESVGLPTWPPRPEQLSSKADLQRREREYNGANLLRLPASEDDGRWVMQRRPIAGRDDLDE